MKNFKDFPIDLRIKISKAEIMVVPGTKLHPENTIKKFSIWVNRKGLCNTLLLFPRVASKFLREEVEIIDSQLNLIIEKLKSGGIVATTGTLLSAIAFHEEEGLKQFPGRTYIECFSAVKTNGRGIGFEHIGGSYGQTDFIIGFDHLKSFYKKSHEPREDDLVFLLSSKKGEGNLYEALRKLREG